MSDQHLFGGVSSPYSVTDTSSNTLTPGGELAPGFDEQSEQAPLMSRFPVDPMPPQSAVPAQYALASLEILNMSEVLGGSPDPMKRYEFQQDIFAFLTERVKQSKGIVVSLHHNVLFMAFPSADSPQQSVHQSIECVLTLLKEPLSWGGKSIQMRCGVDLETRPVPSAVTSVTERSVAPAGGLILSENAYRFSTALPFDFHSLGPLEMGPNQMMFFQVMGRKAPPDIEHLVPQPETYTQPQPVLPPPPPQPVDLTTPVHTASHPEWLQGDPQTSGEYEAPGFHPGPIHTPPEPEMMVDTHLVEPPPDVVYDLPVESPPQVDSPQSAGYFQGTSDPSSMGSVHQEEISPTFDEPTHFQQTPVVTGMAGAIGAMNAEPVETEPHEAQPMSSDVSPPAPSFAPEFVEPQTLQTDFSSGDGLESEEPGASAYSVDSSLQSEPGVSREMEYSTPPVEPQSPLVSPRPQGTERFVYEAPDYGDRKSQLAPSVNYEQAVQQLTQVLGAFLAQGVSAKGMIISLGASEGLGKSTIIQMARTSLNPPPAPGSSSPPVHNAYWLGGSSSTLHGIFPIPLLFWMDVAQNFFGLNPHGLNRDEASSLVSRVLNHLFNGNVPPELLTTFKQFLSIEPVEPLSIDVKERKGRLISAIYDFIAVLASGKPIVLVMEDIHFADPASLEVLMGLMSKGLLELPVAIVMTHRRDFKPAGPFEQILKLVSHQSMVVADLEEGETFKFLNDGPLSGHMHEFPDTVLSQLAKQSHGLPIYMEEGLRMLHLENFLTVDPKTGKFRLKDPSQADSGIMLPATLTEILRMRFKYLSEKAQYALKVASILGEKWNVQTLMDVSQFDQDSLNQFLQELWEHGWIVPDSQTVLRFRHGLMWQCVYELVEPPLKKQLHQLLSDYLEYGIKEMSAVTPAFIGFHSEMAGHYQRAFQYWNQAGVLAAQLGSVTGANMALFHSLKYVSAMPAEQQEELLFQTEENLGLLNMEENTDLSIALMEPLCDQVMALNNAPKAIDILEILTTCYEVKGNYSQAIESQDKILQIFQKEHFPIEYATVQMRKVEYLSMLGKAAAGLDLMAQEVMPLIAQVAIEEDALAFPVFLGARKSQAQMMLQQCHLGALQVLEETQSLAQRENILDLSLGLEMVRAEALLLRGQYGECQSVLESLLNNVENLHNPTALLAKWGMVAIQGHCEVGDWHNASMLIPNCMYQAEQAKDYPTWLLANTYTGWINVGMGRLEDGRKILENAIAASADYRIANCALTGWRFLAETEFKLGNKEIAAEIAQRALDVASKPDIQNRYEHYMLTQVYARALMGLDQIKDAGKLLEPRWQEVIKLGFPPLIAHMAFAVGELYYHMATKVAAKETATRHRGRALEFYTKAEGLWQQLKNPYMTQMLTQMKIMRFKQS